ncbi:MAG: hypothetical protein GPOALKHO_000546 [Sodalis sp.]|uniref:hypothetical protein n=1 Tax=Sodalis sp. (in: enterobacteria) TaxID=1898979 RepID=UPI003873188A|nr:MAG: hypothetical protein GPOALKHO_000546 [Sodalis sp.]
MQSLTPLVLVTSASSGIGFSLPADRPLEVPLIVVGRHQQRFDTLADEFPAVDTTLVVVDLTSAAYMPLYALHHAAPEKANELLHLKCIAPTRHGGTLINVAEMLAFDATARSGKSPAATFMSLDSAGLRAPACAPWSLWKALCSPGWVESAMLLAMFQSQPCGLWYPVAAAGGTLPINVTHYNRPARQPIGRP